MHAFETRGGVGAALAAARVEIVQAGKPGGDKPLPYIIGAV